MQPVTYDFPPVLQGSEWDVKLQFFQDEEQAVPIDLTDYSIDMHVRSKPVAALAPTAIVALSSRVGVEGSGRITILDAATGLIRLRLTSAETSGLEWSGVFKQIPAIAVYWYDIELTNNTSGVVQRVMRGRWLLDAEITKQAIVP